MIGHKSKTPVQQVGQATLDTVVGSAGAVVRGVHDLGGDIGYAAKGAVEGAIEAARDLGLQVEETASAAASGAVRAAGDVSTEAMQEVQKVVTGTIDGVKVVLKDFSNEPARGSRARH